MDFTILDAHISGGKRSKLNGSHCALVRLSAHPRVCWKQKKFSVCVNTTVTTDGGV